MIPTWTTACPDWAERLRDGRSIIPPPIFEDEAEAGLEVMRDLRIVDAPGSPTMGEACNQWIFDLAASIFGAYDPNTGRRLITEWLVLIPKKNFKSGLAASIMLTSLIRNWRQSAEFTILAPTLEVANNSFGPARDMVQFSEDDEPSELSDLIHVQPHIRKLTHRNSGASLKVVATDSATVAGKKSVGTLIDELWLLGKQPNAENMLREALGGLASRPEGFVIYLTTQSDEPPVGVFKKKLEYARKVRDGEIIDPSFVPVLFEHPPDMVKSGEHLKFESLPMVNPNLGASVSHEFLRREYTKAKEEGEESFRGFMAKHGNIEIGLALRSDRWAGADYWERAAHPGGLSLTELLRRSEVVTVGIDGGGLDDLLGLAVIGREVGTGRWLVWTKAWCSPLVLERRKSEASRLRDFERDGDLSIVDKLPDDVQQLVEVVVMCHQSGLLSQIGLDPARVGVIKAAIEAAEVPAELLIGISQGWRLMSAIVQVERKLAAGELVHGGSALMAWCVSNARVEQMKNAFIVTKAASGTAKIDPLMALFCAGELMGLNPEAPGRSWWDVEETAAA